MTCSWLLSGIRKADIRKLEDTRDSLLYSRRGVFPQVVFEGIDVGAVAVSDAHSLNVIGPDP